MILFADTSALLKLFLDEPFTADVGYPSTCSRWSWPWAK